MTERQGMFSIPTRLLLAPEHRAKLDALVRARGVDLTELLSEIVADYLDAQDIQPVAPPPPDTSAELGKRRRELARLRARRDSAGEKAPAWLDAYIATLEDEVRRLEG